MSGTSSDPTGSRTLTERRDPSRDWYGRALDDQGRLVRYRTVICAVLIAWIAATAAWAFRPWPDHVPLTTPDGVESQAARFECGPPLGDPTAVLSDERSSEHRLSRLPCVYRDERRSLAFVNFGLAAAGLVLVGWLTVRSRAATGRRVEPVGPRA